MWGAELEIEEARISNDVGVAEEAGDLGAGDQQGVGEVALLRGDVGQLRDGVVVGDGDDVEAGVAGGFECVDGGTWGAGAGDGA